MPKKPEFTLPWPGQPEADLQGRNVGFLDALVNIFQLDKVSSWEDIRRNITPEQVKLMYEQYAWFWPHQTDLFSIAHLPPDRLRTLFIGNTAPLGTLKHVSRLSLYTDQIIVINPLLNPHTITEEYNPILHPESYVEQTLKDLFLLLELAPWVVAGIVVLLPDPGDFDYQLRIAAWKSAEQRAEGRDLDISREEKIGVDGVNQLEAEMQRAYLGHPESLAQKIAGEYGLTEKQQAEMKEYIESLRMKDPFTVLNPDIKPEFSMAHSSTGTNLEMGTFIANLTGAYLSTDIPYRWKEILSLRGEETNEVEDISNAFQGEQFRFLDGANTQFALQMRKEGRLEMFRNFLRDTWRKTDGGATAPVEFRDRLKEEHAKAEIEWKKIDDDLVKFSVGSSGFLNLGNILLTSGAMDWKAAAVETCLSGFAALLNARSARQRFRINVPGSIFVDVKNNTSA